MRHLQIRNRLHDHPGLRRSLDFAHEGIVAVGKDTLLVSSWEAKTVYRGSFNGEWTDLLLDIEAPADIGWDTKRHVLLVPHFNGNAVTIAAL
jgi:hypothetical protein